MAVLAAQLLLSRTARVCLCVLGLTVSALALVVHAQAPPAEQVDLAVLNRIKEAELNHSQVMELVAYLTDVTGPRLTGSPNLKQAQVYAIDRLRAWGIADAHLEAWGPFGRGWSLEGFTANMSAPTFTPLIAYPKAWSPGTNGPVRGAPLFLDVKTAADLAKYKGQLKGKIVLLTPARSVAPNFLPP